MTLLQVSDLVVEYRTRKGPFRAVRGVSFDLPAGETLALVGESGCGKSSLSRALMGLTPVASGSIVFDGRDITRMPEGQRRVLRRQMQMVFQHPSGSLNPRKPIGAILEAPLLAAGVRSRAERLSRVREMIERVRLPLTALDRYPHEFSGGQRQRISIARALILRPKLVVCDEPVSALDPSIQAQILNLLAEMKRELNLSYLFISHDMAVVRYFADRVMVMNAGQIVETASHDSSFWEQPSHPYSQTLLRAVPSLEDFRGRGDAGSSAG